MKLSNPLEYAASKSTIVEGKLTNPWEVSQGSIQRERIKPPRYVTEAKKFLFDIEDDEEILDTSENTFQIQTTSRPITFPAITVSPETKQNHVSFPTSSTATTTRRRDDYVIFNQQQSQTLMKPAEGNLSRFRAKNQC